MTKLKIALIDYGAGNIQSVQNALNRLGYQAVLTHDPAIITKADKVIFPGVGQASYAMKQLKNYQLDTLIPQLKQDFLGICLGMQLMCNKTEENNTEGLGVFPIDVLKFNHQLKIPHMGWNTLQHNKTPLFKGVKNGEFAYFVHSFYVPISTYTIAQTDYGLNFSAAIQKDNFYATQFHPEKSSQTGLNILKNFLSL